MTISNLKKRVVIQLLLYLLLFIGLVFTLTYTVLYNRRVDIRNQDIIDNIRSINLEVAEIKKKEIVLDKNLDLWERISSLELQSSRQVANLNFELGRLYRKYYILEPEIFISIPEEVKMQYESKYLKVIKSEITMNFSSISDKHIFLFLQSIPSLPGYVAIKSLFLNKEGSIDATVMSQILNGKMIKIIRANMTFDWYTVLNR